MADVGDDGVGAFEQVGLEFREEPGVGEVSEHAGELVSAYLYEDGVFLVSGGGDYPCVSGSEFREGSFRDEGFLLAWPDGVVHSIRSSWMMMLSRGMAICRM